MGLTQSSVKPRASSNEVIHHIYKDSNYKWTQGQIAANIRSHVVSPIYPILEEGGSKKCFCNICYNYYQMINETACCGHGICTECLSAVIPPPPATRVCPLCRAENFGLKVNVDYNNLTHKDDIDSEPPLIIDPDLPDDINCIILQYPNIEKNIIIELHQAGLTAEEIISSINA